MKVNTIKVNSTDMSEKAATIYLADWTCQLADSTGATGVI